MSKIALITGGSRGIGSAIGLKLAESGYDIALNFNKSRERAEEIQKRIQKCGRNCILVQADVADPVKVREMFKEIREKLGEVDTLICNAGISCTAQIQDVSPEMWQRTFSVNVEGMFYCIQEALPAMLKRKKGTVVTVSSMWGLRGASCESVYAATKAAVIGLSRSLAAELGPSGIRVNCVAPGVIETDMMEEHSAEEKEELAEETPLGRLGKPEDVANTVAFLVSEEAVDLKESVKYDKKC